MKKFIDGFCQGINISINSKLFQLTYIAICLYGIYNTPKNEYAALITISLCAIFGFAFLLVSNKSGIANTFDDLTSTEMKCAKPYEIDQLAKLMDSACFQVVLNANDTFEYACADAVNVDYADLWKLLEVEKKFGNGGYFAFIEVYENMNLKSKGLKDRVQVIKPLLSHDYEKAKAYLDGWERFEDIP